MGTSIERIRQYLDSWNWRYQVDSANSRIVTAVRSPAIERLQITIELKENGKFCRMYVPRLLCFHKHPYREAIFRTLLCLSWETKMLRWEYDAIEGEVRAGIELPLEDAPLKERQFHRCISALTQLIGEAIPRLESVMETGIDPVECQRGEQLLLMIQHRAPAGFLERLDKAIALRSEQQKIKQ